MNTIVYLIVLAIYSVMLYRRGRSRGIVIGSTLTAHLIRSFSRMSESEWLNVADKCARTMKGR